jgi:proline iminopeptidase
VTALSETVELPGGGRAAYEVIGAGEPMLYFQGGPGFSASMLRDDAQLLADRFAVYLIDPHGVGGSTPPSDLSEYDHLGHARFYDEVRRALGLDQATIMGISFGSIVALTYAALFPESTTRCVAIAARAVGQEEEGDAAGNEMQEMLARHDGAPWYPEARATWDAFTDRVLSATDSLEVDSMMALILPLYTADPERPGVKRMAEAWSRDGACDLAAIKAWESGLWQKIDIRPLLRDVRAPTLVITGALDLICGPAHTAAILEAIPEAQSVRVEDCGHFVPAEAPEVFRQTVLAFAR